MTTVLSAADVLDREFLGVRAKLIEIAAVLDRIDRASGSVDEDPRLADVRRSLELLAGDRSDRAEQIQSFFSLPYQDNWKSEYFPTPQQ